MKSLDGINTDGKDMKMKKEIVEKFICLNRTNIQLPLIKDFRSFLIKKKDN